MDYREKRTVIDQATGKLSSVSRAQGPLAHSPFYPHQILPNAFTVGEVRQLVVWRGFNNTTSERNIEWEGSTLTQTRDMKAPLRCGLLSLQEVELRGGLVRRSPTVPVNGWDDDELKKHH